MMDNAQFSFLVAVLTSVAGGLLVAYWGLRETKFFERHYPDSDPDLSLALAMYRGAHLGVLSALACIPADMIATAVGMRQTEEISWLNVTVMSLFLGGVIGAISANISTRIIARLTGRRAVRGYLHLPT